MENNTWIKLFRRIREWEWYLDNNTKSLFLEILLTANIEDKNWRGIEVKRGQLITSLDHLAENSGLSVRQVRTSLCKLIKSEEIDKQTTNKYTLITVNNYNTYQDNDKQMTSKRQTNDKQTTTTKEYKEVKNKEYIYKEPNLSNQELEEIASKYKIKIKDVENKYEDMILWYKENPKDPKRKKLDWKATLMNWLRGDIKAKKINKISNNDIPELVTIDEKTRLKNIETIKSLKEKHGLIHKNIQPAQK